MGKGRNVYKTNFMRHIYVVWPNLGLYLDQIRGFGLCRHAVYFCVAAHKMRTYKKGESKNGHACENICIGISSLKQPTGMRFLGYVQIF